jgi:hypothetical protein
MNSSDAKEEFSFERKQRLAARISDMRDKIILKKIRDIIFTNNPDITARKSDGGYLMYFQNYTPNTYQKIEKFLNKVEKEKLERQTRSIAETSEQLVLSSEDPNSDYNISRTRLRYSNREKRLIRRCQYEDIINEPVSDAPSLKSTSKLKINDDNEIKNQDNSDTNSQDDEDNEGNENNEDVDVIPENKDNNDSQDQNDQDSSNDSNNMGSDNELDEKIIPKHNINTKTTLIKAKKGNSKKIKNIKSDVSTKKITNTKKAKVVSNATTKKKPTKTKDTALKKKKGDEKTNVPTIFSKIRTSRH